MSRTLETHTRRGPHHFFTIVFHVDVLFPGFGSLFELLTVAVFDNTVPAGALTFTTT
jgi:hypothetical protein